MNAVKEEVGNSIDTKKAMTAIVSQPFLGTKFRVHKNIDDLIFDAPSKLSQISALDIKQR